MRLQRWPVRRPIEVKSQPEVNVGIGGPVSPLNLRRTRLSTANRCARNGLGRSPPIGLQNLSERYWQHAKFIFVRDEQGRRVRVSVFPSALCLIMAAGLCLVVLWSINAGEAAWKVLRPLTETLSMFRFSVRAAIKACSVNLARLIRAPYPVM